MMNCMFEQCNTDFENAVVYLDHLKNYHRVPANYRYKCTVSTVPVCNQIFSKIYPFKKHIIGHFRSECVDSPIIAQGNEAALDDREMIVQTVPESNDHLPKRQRISMEHSNTHEGRFSDQMNQIEKSATAFTLSLHAKMNVSRKDVYDIQRGIDAMFTEIANQLQDLQMIAPNADSLFCYESYISKMKNLFKAVSSDHKLFNHLKRQEGLPLPSIISIDKNDDIKCREICIEAEKENENNKSYMIMMPIEFQISTFLESNNTLKTILDHTAKLQKSDSFLNFVNGSKWKQVCEDYKGDTILPLWLYSDEFEINDSQSSHSNRHSICGIYYNFPTVPDQFRSKLSHIFVAGMIKKVDMKDTGVNKLLAVMIDRFKSMEENGIKLSINGKHVNVRIILCLLQGDNLGLHTMLQFSSGFNATFYCRFCRRPKELLQADVLEHADCMRRKQDYDEDIELNKQSDTGIAGKSIFNDLPSFHVTENKSVDAMHDLFSGGICKYGMVEIFEYCIYKKQYFTVQQFNYQRKIFSKHCFDSELQRMPDISSVYNSKEKKRSVSFKVTSSEMRLLIHYFPLIVGSFVPKEDVVWNYCKSLIRLVDMCLKRSFSEPEIDNLKEAIEVHHELYKKLFNKDLKPKHHFVVHYPNVIRTSGPVENMMCFRNEAMHKNFKQYAHIMSSRKNICYTLCIKASLQFAYNLLNGIFLKDEVSGDFMFNDMRLFSYYEFITKPMIVKNVLDIAISNKIIYKGTIYRTGNFLTLFVGSNLYLFQILDLMKEKEEFYFIAKLWRTGSFDDHYLAYIAYEAIPQVEIIPINAFSSPPITVHRIEEQLYFRLKPNFNSIDCN